MPPEHEDARARQIEALRRYVARLHTQRERPTEPGRRPDDLASGPTGPRPAPGPRRPPLLTGLLVILALIGGVVVGAVAWSDDRPAGANAGTGGSSATRSPDTTTAPVATPACKTAVNRANTLLAIAVKLRRELAEYSSFMTDPSNGDLAVREVVDKRGRWLRVGARESARFDRVLADYRQIVDRCVVRMP
jgi:hypothetical protein